MGILSFFHEGPKQGTTKDFWHMIWQENVEVIVMVTKLEENGKVCQTILKHRSPLRNIS